MNLITNRTAEPMKGEHIMRSLSFLVCFTLLILGIPGLSVNAEIAEPPQTSIRFGLGVWDIRDNDMGITVHHTDLANDQRFTEVGISGISGTFAVSHMVGQRFAWELSMGGLSNAESQTLSRKVYTRFQGEHRETISSDTHSVSVSYMTVGLIYYPLYELENELGDLSSFFRPYITAGIGPYFGWESRWDGDSIIDANLETNMGAYPGIGLDLLLSRHFIFNVDLRYHLVEFSKPLNGVEDYSGLNAIAGFKVAF